jgi:hypothetical protein
MRASVGFPQRKRTAALMGIKGLDKMSYVRAGGRGVGAGSWPRTLSDSAIAFAPCWRSPRCLMLSGCGLIVLDPAGEVARQQGNLVMISTALMLLIIVPVMALTVFFAFKYRAANQDAPYDPDWDHSTQLELVIWAAPLLIIICLGALTWVGTHLLDPYRPLAAAEAKGPGAPRLIAKSRWRCRSSRSIGNGCSSTPNRASRR